MITSKALFICNGCGELLLDPEVTSEEYCPSCGVELSLNQTYKEIVNIKEEDDDDVSG